MCGEKGAQQWVKTFMDQCRAGKLAELRFHCEGGHLKVTMCADLGPVLHKKVNLSGCGVVESGSPSRARRRERRAAERAAAENAAAEKVAAEKAAAEKVAAERNAAKKATAEKYAAEKAAAEKCAAEKAAADKCAKEKASAEKCAAMKAAGQKCAAEKAAADKCANEKAAAQKGAARKASEEKATTSVYGKEEQVNLEQAGEALQGLALKATHVKCIVCAVLGRETTKLEGTTCRSCYC